MTDFNSRRPVLTAEMVNAAAPTPPATPVQPTASVEAVAEIAKLKRINAEHCAAINALNVENAALEDKLRDVQHRLLIRARAAENKLASLTPAPTQGDGASLAKAMAVVRMFKERIERHGNWDEGCFYYGRTSASELQEPLRLAADLMKEVRHV